MERETRFELATPTLARSCSTAELFPHSDVVGRKYSKKYMACKVFWQRNSKKFADSEFEGDILL